jgi:hypothetical protein
MTAMAAAFAAAGDPPVASVFGPSGLLRERIEKGESTAVFASADVNHPQAFRPGPGGRDPRSCSHAIACGRWPRPASWNSMVSPPVATP